MPFPFRLGATSYCIPAGLAENARWLGGRVQDMELVLFRAADGQSNYPDAQQVEALRLAGEELDLTFTVHLPLDLNPERGHPSVEQAQDVIRRSLALRPPAFVAHLDGRAVLDAAPGARRKQRWEGACCRLLERLGRQAGGVEALALENLEHYPPDFWDGVLARVGVSRCVDAGHLWLEGRDPLPVLHAALGRLRVVHLHGVRDGRDHTSLAHLPAARLDPVLQLLCAAPFRGVVTLEVFGEEDFSTSLVCVHAFAAR